MNTSRAALMLRKLRAIVPALVVLSFVGGSQTALADEPVNPFAGVWSGTFAGTCCGEGTQEWTISDSGRLTGTAHNTVNGSDIIFVGHVGSEGKVTLSANGGGGMGGSWEGEVAINKKGQFVGTFIANNDNSLRDRREARTSALKTVLGRPGAAPGRLRSASRPSAARGSPSSTASRTCVALTRGESAICESPAPVMGSASGNRTDH